MTKTTRNLGNAEVQWRTWLDAHRIVGDGNGEADVSRRKSAYLIVESWRLTETSSQRLLACLNEASLKYALDDWLQDQCDLDGAALRKHLSELGRRAATLAQMLDKLGPAEKSVLATVADPNDATGLKFIDIDGLRRDLDCLESSAETVCGALNIAPGPRGYRRLDTLLASVLPVLVEVAGEDITISNDRGQMHGSAARFLELYVGDLDPSVAPNTLVNAVRKARDEQRREKSCSKIAS